MCSKNYISDMMSEKKERKRQWRHDVEKVTNDLQERIKSNLDEPEASWANGLLKIATKTFREKDIRPPFLDKDGKHFYHNIACNALNCLIVLTKTSKKFVRFKPESHIKIQNTLEGLYAYYLGSRALGWLSSKDPRIKAFLLKEYPEVMESLGANRR